MSYILGDLYKVPVKAVDYQGVRSSQSCLLCNRTLKNEFGNAVLWNIETGEVWDKNTPKNQIPDSVDWWPVGSECYRRIVEVYPNA